MWPDWASRQLEISPRTKMSVKFLASRSRIRAVRSLTVRTWRVGWSMKGKEMNAVPSKARGREAWVGWIGPEGEKRTERRGRISGLALEDRAQATPYYSTLLLIVK